MPETLYFDRLLLPTGWARNARLTIDGGRISQIEIEQARHADEEGHACGVPGLPNLHSHAFQRVMAGLTESRGDVSDSFWTWRELMYRFVARMTPQDLNAVASLAYAEMLETGFTRVGEFHYLHHDLDGSPFSDPAEMCSAIVAAADRCGIGLTLLPVLYSYSGFGAREPGPAQARFLTNVDSFTRIAEGAEIAASHLPDAVVGVAPHSLRAVSPDQLRELASLCSDRPIHIHVAEQVKEVDDCMAWCGSRPIAWLLDNCPVDDRWCLVHATHMTQSEVERLARSGAIAGLCPITEANLGDGIFPAVSFLEAGGGYGIGSDSNILIDATEELRLLEYGQRLVHRSRNMMALRPGRSTGMEMYLSAVSGGARALGVSAGLVVGAAADLLSIDVDHPALMGASDKTIVDGLLFAAGRNAIDCVWRYGRKVVSQGRHHRREEIERAYRIVVKRFVA